MAKYDFQDKVAIITGASSGIGRATALHLASSGARVTLAARRVEALQELARQIQAGGGHALVTPTDVCEPAQVTEMVQSTLARWGQVDILVSNAGQYFRSPIAQMNIATLEKSMRVNFYSQVYAVQAVLPHMLERRSGHILLVSSMDGKKALPPDGPYVIAKFALSGFGDTLRQELHGTGVYCTTVYPGRIDTPMIADIKVPNISAKISPEAVAKDIAAGIVKRKAELYLPWQVLPLYYLQVISPRLADWAVRTLHLAGWEKPQES